MNQARRAKIHFLVKEGMKPKDAYDKVRRLESHKIIGRKKRRNNG